MATRSFIALEDNGLHTAVYCHWDGYPAGVGKILAEHYDDRTKVKELLEHGDLSSLGRTIEESEFYAKRGEKLKVRRNLLYRELHDACAGSGAEFLYVFRNNKWEIIAR